MLRNVSFDLLPKLLSPGRDETDQKKGESLSLDVSDNTLIDKDTVGNCHSLTSDERRGRDSNPPLLLNAIKQRF